MIREKISYFGIFESDLDLLIENNPSQLYNFQDKTITIFGGTGFVGKWLTASLINADQKLDLNLNLRLFTRNKKQLLVNLRNSSTNKYEIVEVDFAKSNPIDIQSSDYYFHLATSSSIKTGSNLEKNVYESTVNVINQTVKNLSPSTNAPVFIHASSGAVYGEALSSKGLIEEKPSVIISNKNSLYCNSKVTAENLIDKYSRNLLIKGMNPRLFAFAGPHLALDEHFAIGNFVLNAVRGEDIIVKGNPETVRSYMYPTDLINWLVRLALEPSTSYMNFGSDSPITIDELSKIIKDFNQSKGIKYIAMNSKFTSYVPSTINARKHLNISEIIPLSTSIDKWMKWLRMSQQYL